MSNEVRADPVELTRVADQMLRSSQQIDDAWRAAQGPLAVPATAFGDSIGAAAVAQAQDQTVDDAEVTLGRLVAVLEGDMDRLYRIAFAYKKADDDAAAKARQQQRNHRNIPI
ncbi:MAG: hypothetical protein HOV71_28640 [Hamadaea sp.]|uniref:hypothetical protein n=1 Tax=Hamadaea sp. NPDC050747 TaxID=3155789 RepID=UPI0017C2B5C8|nr:hypothetical protein [Hamadaea sp.]NUR52111.1 hypothetical protein [Hamadaea sp.]